MRSTLIENQHQTPLLDELRTLAGSDVLSFHMPGHLGGRGAAPELQALLEKALQADLTQVLGLDDIHRPTGATGKAQRLAAEAYGADHSYFLVNGSTSGNQAMLLAAVRPGESVLVPRNAHRSTMAAILLAGARPVYYEPPYDPELCVHHCPTPQQIEAALARNPEIKAVLFTSPTYYGAAADVHGLTAAAHRRDIPVLVDEAWGPHLRFHPDLPDSAVDAGADLVVQSTHKLLGGLSQASILHLRGTRVDRDRLEAVLRMLLTTSPNYLLLASLDAARRQMVEHGRALWERALFLAGQTRQRLNEIPGVRCLDLRARAGVHAFDATRLLVQVEGASGYEVERELKGRGILVELSERQGILALVYPAHREEELERLVAEVRAVATGAPKKTQALEQTSETEKPTEQASGRTSGRTGKEAPVKTTERRIPTQALTPREAFDRPHDTVPLDSATERISAQFLTLYPPGIPLLCPGEVVSRDLLDRIAAERAAGARLEPDTHHLRVVKQ